MTQSLPILFQEHLQLFKINLGFRVKNVGFETVTLESDKFVCIRERISGRAMYIIDINKASLASVWRTDTADSVIMNPAGTIIAEIAETTLRIFELATKTLMKTHTFGERVVFWKWVLEDTLALVTETAVYHWSMKPYILQPRIVFDRNPALKNNKIVNYRVEAGQRLLIGVKYKPPPLLASNSARSPPTGLIQLHSRETSTSRLMQGSVAAFARIQLEGNAEPSNLLCYAVKRDDSLGKIHILEVGPTPVGNQQLGRKIIHVVFGDDVPVALEVSSKYGLIYLITKNGLIHIYDIEWATHILKGRITRGIFATAAHESMGGVIGVNRNGQVFSVTIKEKDFVPYIREVLKNPLLARRVATRFSCLDPKAAAKEMIDTATKLVEELKRLKVKDQSNECVICLCPRERPVAFIPCGHICACHDCATNYWQEEMSRVTANREPVYTRCPYCTGKSENFIHVYMC